MPTVDTDDDYLRFQDFLTSYRKTRLLISAWELGIFDCLSQGCQTGISICSRTGMDADYGVRFLDVLAGFGFLEICGDGYALSDFSERYLQNSSTFFQGNGIEFEKTLIESWTHLTETLKQGNRVFGAAEKTKDEYRASLDNYLSAMDNAARIRAGELWSRLNPGKHGLIVDAGAGSGAFLIDFLNRHETWEGVFCDLPDVVNRALKHPDLKPFLGRLTFSAVNLLEDLPLPSAARADILLCSNLVHCHGKKETQGVLDRLVPTLSGHGVLVIHDFFSDKGGNGALYDLHMMLNTYNGRAYSTVELCGMLEPHRLTLRHDLSLDSSSSAIIFSRHPLPDDFAV